MPVDVLLYNLSVGPQITYVTVICVAEAGGGRLDGKEISAAEATNGSLNKPTINMNSKTVNKVTRGDMICPRTILI